MWRASSSNALPSLANPEASARPMPELAPVITTSGFKRPTPTPEGPRLEFAEIAGDGRDYEALDSIVPAVLRRRAITAIPRAAHGCRGPEALLVCGGRAKRQ
jgi:hypothetical protein